jgi:ribosome-binding ATPase YchF (GTP1/OBG family)
MHETSEEPQSDIEIIEEEFECAFGSDLSDVYGWLNKKEKDFQCQNLTEETAQQTEVDGSSEEDEEDEKEETCGKFKFLEVNKLLTPSSVLEILTHNTINIT